MSRMLQTRSERLRSPSGLLTAAGWQRDWQRHGLPLPEPGPSGGTPPDHPDQPDQDRQFATWVQIEAKTLAGQLERLAQPGARRGLSRHLRALATALAEDAEWARRRIDDR